MHTVLEEKSFNRKLAALVLYVVSYMYVKKKNDGDFRKLIEENFGVRGRLPHLRKYEEYDGILKQNRV